MVFILNCNPSLAFKFDTICPYSPNLTRSLRIIEWPFCKDFFEAHFITVCFLHKLKRLYSIICIKLQSETMDCIKDVFVLSMVKRRSSSTLLQSCVFLNKQIQSVPKKSIPFEIKHLLEFECLITMLN